MRKTESEIFISGINHFTNSLFITENLVVNLVNGKPLFKELVPLHGPDQLVDGPVQFHGNVVVNGDLDLTDAPINGIPAAQFLKGYQFLNGDMHVVDHSIRIHGNSVEIESLTVEGLINGKNFTDIIASSVLLNQGVSHIYGEKTFHAPIRIEGDSTIAVYNDINLPQLFANILRTSDDWNITNSALIKYMSVPLMIVHRGNVEVDTFSGSTDFNQMLKDAVHVKDGPMQSVDTMHFEHLIVGRNIEGVQTLNYKDVKNLIPLHSQQHVGALKFKEVTFSGANLPVTGRIDEVDINKAYIDALKVKNIILLTS